MGRSINFVGRPAFFFACPVCGGTHVGGSPDEDKTSEEFMRKHSMWHEHASTEPPPSIVLPR